MSRKLRKLKERMIDQGSWPGRAGPRVNTEEEEFKVRGRGAEEDVSWQSSRDVGLKQHIQALAAPVHTAAGCHQGSLQEPGKPNVANVPHCWDGPGQQQLYLLGYWQPSMALAQLECNRNTCYMTSRRHCPAAAAMQEYMDNLLVETVMKSYSEEESRALELQAPHAGAPLPDTVVRSKVSGIAAAAAVSTSS